jgi:hypothetical protein
MRQTVPRWVFTLALALTPWIVAAQAVPALDARAVREVVEAQLKALAADDAGRAFSYASPMIRNQFGDAANFMAMVKSGYPMVVRPATTAFFQPEAADGAVMQVVQLRGRDGRVWLATYELQRQPDGRWRINGCAVLPDTGKSST